MAGGTEVKPASKAALPVITFNDRATVHVNGEDIRAIHFPHGHTDGDSVIFFPQSNVVHMGDTSSLMDFRSSNVQSGGSVSGMIAGVEKVLSLTPPDVKVIPGHGPLQPRKTCANSSKLLKETRALVAQAANEGKSPDEMKQDHLLAKYEEFGKGFIKTGAWIDLLYAEATRKTGARVATKTTGTRTNGSKGCVSQGPRPLGTFVRTFVGTLCRDPLSNCHFRQRIATKGCDKGPESERSGQALLTPRSPQPPHEASFGASAFGFRIWPYPPARSAFRIRLRPRRTQTRSRRRWKGGACASSATTSVSSARARPA